MLSWIHTRITGWAVLPDFVAVFIAVSFLFAKQARTFFVSSELESFSPSIHHHPPQEHGLKCDIE